MMYMAQVVYPNKGPFYKCGNWGEGNNLSVLLSGRTETDVKNGVP